MNSPSLCKHLYYTEGSFYLKYKTNLSESIYIHTEESPQPLYFSLAIHNLIQSKSISMEPHLTVKQTNSGSAIHIQSFYFKSLQKCSIDIFSQSELHTIETTVTNLNGDITFENKYYPDLYKLYVSTQLYSTIALHQLDSEI